MVIKKAKAKPKGKKKPKRRSKALSRKPDKPKTGRRTTMTDALISDMVTVIKAGNYYTTACSYLNLPESTFYSWMKRGETELMRIMDLEEDTGKAIEPEESELIYVEFLEAIKNADATAEVAAVMKVKSAFAKDWKAAMTYLERRFPDRWKRKDRHEFTGADGKDLVPVVVYIPDNGRDKK